MKLDCDYKKVKVLFEMKCRLKLRNWKLSFVEIRGVKDMKTCLSYGMFDKESSHDMKEWIHAEDLWERERESLACYWTTIFSLHEWN